MTKWRQYRPSDEPALRARHEAQCRAIERRGGAGFRFPDLQDPRYVCVMVAVRDGQITGAVVAHATVEVMFVGADAEAARAAVRDGPALKGELVSRGCDEAHAFVPAAVEEKMRPLLRRLGFRRSDERWIPYYCELT